MLGLHPWWLDLWASMAMFMTMFAFIFSIVGVAGVAVSGRKGWPKELNSVIVLFIGAGVLFPFIILAIPFIALYRAVRNK